MFNETHVRERGLGGCGVRSLILLVGHYSVGYRGVLCSRGRLRSGHVARRRWSSLSSLDVVGKLGLWQGFVSVRFRLRPEPLRSLVATSGLHACCYLLKTGQKMTNHL